MSDKNNLVQDAYKLDANESAFFQRQLEYVKSESYDVKQAVPKAFQLIPVTNDITCNKV